MKRSKGSRFFLAALLFLISESVVLPLSSGPAAAQDVFTGNPIAKIVKEASPAVVNIDTEAMVQRSFSPFPDDPFFREFFGDRFDRFSREVPMRGKGSGFIVTGDGYILTNNHVVDGPDNMTIEVTLSDGRSFPARVVGKDPSYDLAVIKIDSSDLPTVPMGDSDRIEVGEWVIAIGNPYGFESSVTVGVVSAKNRSVRARNLNFDGFIQTDAAINPGNSGGPLLNIYGQVIGINTAIVDPDVGTTLGFAIPVNVALRYVDSIIATGSIQRAYLGVYLDTVTESTARSLGLKIDRGALIMDVVAGSAADKAGIKPQDVIVKFQNLEITNSSELRAAILNYPAGSEVSVVVNRFGETIELKVMLGTLQEQVQAITPQEQKAAEDTALGVTVNDIAPSDRERLSLPEDLKGVIVSGVSTQGIVYRLGLSIDDVITRISVNGNQQAIQSVDDFKKVVDSLKKGDYIAFFIYRDGVRFVASFQY